MLRLTQAGAKLLPGWTGRPQSRALITHCSRPERPDLRKLAEMAHISISDAEVSRVQRLRYSTVYMNAVYVTLGWPGRWKSGSQRCNKS